MAKIRLDKFIAEAAAMTRSEAKKLIRSGKVSIDGTVIKDEAFKTEEDADNILINGKNILLEKFIYIMMNKPYGVISAVSDAKHKTVIDLLGAEYSKKGLFPVGRLDIDTTGLMIITNDGAFAHTTLSPKKHVTKIYEAEVEHYSASEDSIKRFADGITLADGYKCLPAKLRIISRQNDITKAEIEITEGKYHQVKRMFAAESGHVAKLKRITFGRIQLDKKLPEGGFRRLNEDEMKFVKEISGQ